MTATKATGFGQQGLMLILLLNLFIPSQSGGVGDLELRHSLPGLSHHRAKMRVGMPLTRSLRVSVQQHHMVPRDGAGWPG